MFIPAPGTTPGRRNTSHDRITSRMDLRELVDRIAAALGTAATPARVEAVADLVLELAATAVAPARNAAGPDATGPDAAASDNPLPRRAVLLAYGVHRPGIEDVLGRAAAEAGCRLLETSRQDLDGYFSLIMLLDVDPSPVSLAALQRRLTDTAARLNVSVLVQHEWLFKNTSPF